ncbi:MAG: hypothetical protein A2491_04360, partial [Bacteroidetes bacterium RIFOXYC12_FULL_35_7]
MRILIFISFVFISVAAHSQLNNPAFNSQDFYKTNPLLDSLTNHYFSQLNDTQRVGQMIIQATGAIAKPKKEIIKSIEKGYIGGVIYLKVTREECIVMEKEFQKIADSAKTLPMLLSTDGEPSLIHYKIKDFEKVKKTNTIASVEESAETGIFISKKLRELGIRYNFAPVCDLAINKEVINNRSYGADKEKVVELCKAFVRASHAEQVAATIKHFPGHGNVKGDSHKNLVSIDGEMIELEVFKKLIEDSVISVMVGHIAVKNNEKYSTNGDPATCSRKIVTDLLRNELGFKGIIITDGMNMGALG